MRIADIQRFCTHDGPGIRTTVFLKGCPLRCLWCHNPEAQGFNKELLYYESKCIACRACAFCGNNVHRFEVGHALDRDECVACGECAKACPTKALEIVGIDLTVREVFDVISRDFAFYGKNGGVTLSGGEPFMQADDAIALLELCRSNGINTAVETCGSVDPKIIKRAVGVTDLFLWDIKDTDNDRHIKYTGVSNERIISNLLLADSLGAKTVVRCITVNGVNTNEAHYNAIADIVLGLKHCEGVELIPYHSFGGAKTVALGCENEPHDGWIPTKEQLDAARSTLRLRGVKLLC